MVCAINIAMFDLCAISLHHYFKLIDTDLSGCHWLKMSVGSCIHSALAQYQVIIFAPTLH